MSNGLLVFEQNVSELQYIKFFQSSGFINLTDEDIPANQYTIADIQIFTKIYFWNRRATNLDVPPNQNNMGVEVPTGDVSTFQRNVFNMKNF